MCLAHRCLTKTWAWMLQAGNTGKPHLSEDAQDQSRGERMQGCSFSPHADGPIGLLPASLAWRAAVQAHPLLAPANWRARMGRL